MQYMATNPDIYFGLAQIAEEYHSGQIEAGRGITSRATLSSRGEVYQGPFVYDTMEEKGLFQWSDGSLSAKVRKY